MRVVLVNAVEATGGAARATHRLYRGLQSAGLSAQLFTKEKQSDDRNVVAFAPSFDADAVFRRHAAMQEILDAYQGYEATRQPSIEIFSHPALDEDDSFLEQLPDADIYNLHWVAGFVEFPVFFGPSAPRRPVVWTLHDQGPFTGGCHYDLGCGRFKAACGACPLLGSDDPNDLSARNLSVKLAALEDWPEHLLHIVTPSEWLASEARASALFKRFEVTCIPNSIDTDQFQAIPKLDARRALGLPEQGFFLLFVANQINAPRKGASLLFQALEDLPDPQGAMLLCVGDDHLPSPEAAVPIAQLDYVGDDTAMAHLYAAADLTVIPSLQDNLPNTMLESLSCGTPVVGFDVGGIPDSVIAGQTGWLAAPGDPASLAAAITEARADPERLSRMGQQGRDHVLSRYRLERQAGAYSELFDAMVQASKTRA